MFIGGPLLGYLLLRVADVNGWAMRLLPAVTLLALVISAIVVLMQAASWRQSIALFSRPRRWCRITAR
jgi:DMSO reductase anchor subunit